MTRDEVIARAMELAASHNWPWDAATMEVRTWRVWPFARVWQVRSRIADGNAVASMRISNRTRTMVYGRVMYADPATPPTKQHGQLHPGTVIDLLLGEVLVPVYSALFLLGFAALLIGRRSGHLPIQAIGWGLMVPEALWFLALFGIVLPLSHLRRRILRWQSRKRH